jgi:hypothetical protein
MSESRRPAIRITQLLLAMLMALGAIIVSSPGASAASCYNTSCNGQDPQTASCDTGLSSPRTAWPSNEILVELRYSSECDAYWGRVHYSGLWNCCHNFTLQAEQQRWNGSTWSTVRTKATSMTLYNTNNYHWTVMNPDEANDRHRVCLYGPSSACTAWNS